MPSRLSTRRRVIAACALGAFASLAAFAAARVLLPPMPMPLITLATERPAVTIRPVDWPAPPKPEPAQPAGVATEQPAAEAAMSVPSTPAVLDAPTLLVAVEPPIPAPTASSAVVATSATPTAAPPSTLPSIVCGAITCAPGDLCCSARCGICVAPGAACDRQDCGFERPPTSTVCGFNTCNVGEVCCNPTCGVCTLPGATCDPTPCGGGPVFPVSQACGMNTCNVGHVCCDATCGLCAPVAECATRKC